MEKGVGGEVAGRRIWGRGGRESVDMEVWGWRGSRGVELIYLDKLVKGEGGYT